nr:hypothetical protein [Tanacetum cinerariifolium]
GACRGPSSVKEEENSPLSFALDESEGDDFTRIGFRTHHSASPINTVIPENIDPGASGGGLILEAVNRAEDDVDHSYDNEGGIEVKSPPIDHSLEP